MVVFFVHLITGLVTSASMAAALIWNVPLTWGECSAFFVAAVLALCADFVLCRFFHRRNPNIIELHFVGFGIPLFLLCFTIYGVWVSQLLFEWNPGTVTAATIFVLLVIERGSLTYLNRT